MTPSPTPPEPYISAQPRARIAIIFLIIGAVISALTIPIEILEATLPDLTPDQEMGDNPAMFVTVILHGLLGLLTVAVYIATVVVYLMWLHRCCRNLYAFGFWRSQIGHSPGWAVGSFFVPIVNLFVPYRAIKEVWQKSQPASTEMFAFSQSPPGFFPTWWAFWLLSNFASNIYLRMTMAEAPRPATAIVGVLSDVFSIAAAGFAIMVIREITRRQEETSQQLTLHHAGPPPPPDFRSSESS